MKYRISFKSYGIKGTPTGQYTRIGYIHIPYILGGLSIPIPIVRFEKRIY